MRARRHSRLALIGLVAGSVTLLSAGISTLATAAAGPNQTLSANTSSSYQTNNTVRSVTVAGGVVYAGGLFTSVRPPGAAIGTSETPRSYLAAFSTTSGAPTAFAPTLNGAVYASVVSADGSKLYVAGNFTLVNGLTRNHFAAFDLATGALDTSWVPSATGGHGYSIAFSGTTVYLGAPSPRLTASRTRVSRRSTRRPVPCSPPLPELLTVR